MNDDIKILVNELSELLAKRDIKHVIFIDYEDEVSLLAKTNDDYRFDGIADQVHNILFYD